jgi:hypothetical protein
MTSKTMTRVVGVLIVLALVGLLIFLAIGASLPGLDIGTIVPAFHGIKADKQLGVKGDAGILPDKSTHGLSPDGGQLIPLSEPHEGRVNA